MNYRLMCLRCLIVRVCVCACVGGVGNAEEPEVFSGASRGSANDSLEVH